MTAFIYFFFFNISFFFFLNFRKEVYSRKLISQFNTFLWDWPFVFSSWLRRKKRERERKTFGHGQNMISRCRRRRRHLRHFVWRYLDEKLSFWVLRPVTLVKVNDRKMTCISSCNSPLLLFLLRLRLRRRLLLLLELRCC